MNEAITLKSFLSWQCVANERFTECEFRHSKSYEHQLASVATASPKITKKEQSDEEAQD